MNYPVLRSQSQRTDTVVKTEEELNDMLLTDLRKECVGLGIKKSGSKEDVIQRLLIKYMIVFVYDHNNI